MGQTTRHCRDAAGTSCSSRSTQAGAARTLPAATARSGRARVRRGAVHRYRPSARTGPAAPRGRRGQTHRRAGMTASGARAPRAASTTYARVMRPAGKPVATTRRLRRRGWPTSRGPRWRSPICGTTSPSRTRPRRAARPARGCDGRRSVRRRRRGRTRGRLVLLYDPAGQQGWAGEFRVIAYIRAEVEPEMAADPLLGEVGWSWLTEALDAHAPGYAAPSGTVTRVITEGFGGKQDEPTATGLELRASWSPARTPADVGGDVAAWCDLLASAAGRPPQPPGTRALRASGAAAGARRPRPRRRRGPRPGRTGTARARTGGAETTSSRCSSRATACRASTSTADAWPRRSPARGRQRPGRRGRRAGVGLPLRPARLPGPAPPGRAGTVLIDPVACPDLSGLDAALAGTEAVLHAAWQDLPCLAELGYRPRPLFDTELAGRLLGYPRVGLAPLVEEVLGLRLAKEHSAADWSTRPLPAEMAALRGAGRGGSRRARDALARQLEEQGKTEWARQEFAAVLAAKPPPPRPDPWRRTSGIHRVRTRRGLAVVRELWQERDAIARRRICRRGRVLADAADHRGGQAAAGRRRTSLTAIRGFTGRGARRHRRNGWPPSAGPGPPESALPAAAAPAADGPPPAHRWAERDPAAARRLTAVRAAVAALGDRTLPVGEPAASRRGAQAGLEAARPADPATRSPRRWPATAPGPGRRSWPPGRSPRRSPAPPLSRPTPPLPRSRRSPAPPLPRPTPPLPRSRRSPAPPLPARPRRSPADSAAPADPAAPPADAAAPADAGAPADPSPARLAMTTRIRSADVTPEQTR